MMKHTKIVTTLAALGLGFGFAGCGNGNPVVLTPPPPNGPAVKYIQIERLSRPVIKEVFEPFQHHQISNGIEPYNDPTIQADIATTEDAVRYGGTPASGPDYGKALQGILYPDEYTVNLSGGNPTKTTQGEYLLSTETSNGADFGGRAPNDDVIDLELGILFGNTIPALGLAPTDDLKENTCLSSQNIAAPYVYGMQNARKTATPSFPYFPTPS